MILSGIKKEEYRDIKKHWIDRLLIADFAPGERPFVFEDNQKHYDAIKFTNGYGPKFPSMLVEYKGVNIGWTKEKWVDTFKDEVFVLSLGEILEVKNVNSIPLSMRTVLYNTMPKCAEVIELQRVLGLPANGIFEEATLKALYAKWKTYEVRLEDLARIETVRDVIPLQEIPWLAGLGK